MRIYLQIAKSQGEISHQSAVIFPLAPISTSKFVKHSVSNAFLHTFKPHQTLKHDAQNHHITHVKRRNR